MPTRIRPTIHALQGDVTSLDGKKGVDAIKRWEGDLETADWRGAKTIHTNLVALRQHLEGGDLDAAKISDLLTKLGDETARAASHAGGTTTGQLEELADALKSAAQGLGQA